MLNKHQVCQLSGQWKSGNVYHKVCVTYFAET